MAFFGVFGFRLACVFCVVEGGVGEVRVFWVVEGGFLRVILE